MRAHHEVIARDDHGRSVRFARDGEDQLAAVALLDAAEADAGGPLVDEHERDRLDHVARHDADPEQHWHPILAWDDRDATPVGYAGILLQPGQGGAGDVVLGADAPKEVVGLLLDAGRRLGDDHGAAAVELWVRHAEPDLLDHAFDSGWSVARRLLVLGRDLPPEADEDPTTREDVELRAATEADLEAIAEVLAAAYAGTADGGWTPEDLAERWALPWFDLNDLLVAQAPDGAIAGIHWTKRRDDTTGEVYNLAVHPDWHGRGLGTFLLDAGLAHLADRGASHVVLWVDAANEPALRLYGSRGFTERWQDVALACAIC